MVFKGDDVIKMSGRMVYGWFRNGEYLYIGFTGHGFGRISKHNIINRAEPIQGGDEIHVWFAEDELVLERLLNHRLSPKYSNRYSREDDMKQNRICPVCKSEFKPKRYWQQFCTAICRGGNNPSM